MDKFPPHSIEAEQGVLGCILLASDAFEEARAQITARAFYDVRHQTIFLGCDDLHRAGSVIDLTLLSAWLTSNNRMEDAGGIAYVASLLDSVSSVAALPDYIDRVSEKQKFREFSERCRTMAEAASKPGANKTEIAEDLRIALAEFAQGEGNGELLGVIEAHRFKPEVVPLPLRPIYSLCNTPVCTPGNLTAITAQIKTGKTAVVKAMLTAALVNNSDIDCLGFTSGNPKNIALVHIDTEQSPDDHWHHVQEILRRAKLTAPPAWFYSYCLTGLAARRVVECFDHIIKTAADAHGGIHSALIDGVADMATDVNDAAECNALVASLHATAIEYDCPIASVIHFNPGGEKVRGHLGSQLERKAETNLRLDKTDGVTTIWSDKQRRAPIPKGAGPCFQWSDAAGMHVSVESQQSAADKEKAESLVLLADDIFRKRPAMNYSDLVKYLTAKKGLALSERTAARRIKELSKLGIIEKSVAGLWTRKT
jgi:hypothetical protein